MSKFVVRNPNGARATYVNNDFIAAKRVGTGAMILGKFPTGASVEFDRDTKVTPSIFFGNVKGAEYQSVIPTLVQFRDAVTNTINVIEQAII